MELGRRVGCGSSLAASRTAGTNRSERYTEDGSRDHPPVSKALLEDDELFDILQRTRWNLRVFETVIATPTHQQSVTDAPE